MILTQACAISTQNKFNTTQHLSIFQKILCTPAVFSAKFKPIFKLAHSLII